MIQFIYINNNTQKMSLNFQPTWERAPDNATIIGPGVWMPASIRIPASEIDKTPDQISQIIDDLFEEQDQRSIPQPLPC